jgi:hypothetical protein
MLTNKLKKELISNNISVCWYQNVKKLIIIKYYIPFGISIQDNLITYSYI